MTAEGEERPPPGESGQQGAKADDRLVEARGAGVDHVEVAVRIRGAA
jgi:hypothetical protein